MVCNGPPTGGPTMSHVLNSIVSALGLAQDALEHLHLHTAGALPSTFEVTEL
uniref:FAD-dependent oxidoreductase n=1 Tax=Steinernema glaseri TaxID=37863 RepID=A0A1I8AQ89_9BILA